ncbi:MAG: cyclase/dehydrase [Mycobacterium sp.]|jgi:aromatase|nr:cyclase/dehydrase [Mycobacterium sp.]
MEHTSHSIDIAAPADRVYRIIADVTAWPVHFPPTVHAERVHGDDRKERIRVWAVANGELHSWESDRLLDDAARTIDFQQTRPRHPVAAMGGSWRVDDRGGGESHVVLTHFYAAVGADPAGSALIGKAVDTNSMSELAAIKTVAERGVAPLEFADSEVISGSVEDVYEFVHASDRWPERLPHVRRVHLTESEPGLQLMEMDTESPDGSVHTTVSWRVCVPGSRITYKQTKPPGIVSVHNGEWTFRELPGGAVRATSGHTVVIDEEALAALKAGGTSPTDPAEAIREALGGNSRATLHAAKVFAERGETVNPSGHPEEKESR